MLLDENKREKEWLGSQYVIIMATWNNSQSIEKFNEDNYESWKLQMKSILICNELGSYANGDEVKTEANREE